MSSLSCSVRGMCSQCECVSVEVVFRHLALVVVTRCLNSKFSVLHICLRKSLFPYHNRGGRCPTSLKAEQVHKLLELGPQASLNSAYFFELLIYHLLLLLLLKLFCPQCLRVALFGLHSSGIYYLVRMLLLLVVFPCLLPGKM